MQWYIYIYTNNLWAHKMRHCFKNSTLFMGKERSVLAFLDSKARWRAHVTPPKCILPQTTITSYALFFVPPGPWLPPPLFFFWASPLLLSVRISSECYWQGQSSVKCSLWVTRSLYIVFGNTRKPLATMAACGPRTPERWTFLLILFLEDVMPYTCKLEKENNTTY